MTLHTSLQVPVYYVPGGKGLELGIALPGRPRHYPCEEMIGQFTADAAMFRMGPRSCRAADAGLIAIRCRFKQYLL